MERRTLGQPPRSNCRWALVLWLVAAISFSIAAAAMADLEELEAELSARFRAIELSDGYLFEPLPGHEDLPVVEISDGELWIDGAPATAGSLARLGDLESAVRALAERHGVELDASRLESAEAVERTLPEAPEAPEVRRRVYKDDQVVVGGNLVVAEDEIARDVVVMGGRLTILGQVNGDAAVIGGSAEIHGEVHGDVAIVGGSAEIGPTAHISGKVETVGGSVDVDDDAVVEGEINEVSFGAGLRIGRWVEEVAKGAAASEEDQPDGDVDIEIEPDDYEVSGPVHGGARLVGAIFSFLFLCIVSCLALLFLRGPIERMADQTRIEPAKCGLVGLVAWILLVPLLLITVLILVISVIGIPLLVLVPFVLIGFAILVFLGFVSVAVEVGRFLRERFELNIASPFVLLLLGLAVIQVWALVGDLFGAMGRYMGFLTAMFTAFGLLVSFLAVTIGLGAALITRAGTRAPVAASFAWESDDAWDEPPATDEPRDPAARNDPED